MQKQEGVPARSVPNNQLSSVTLNQLEMKATVSQAKVFSGRSNSTASYCVTPTFPTKTKIHLPTAKKDSMVPCCGKRKTVL